MRLDAEKTAVVVVTTMKAAIGPVLERVATLEARPPVAGQKGERGDPGARGEQGTIGPDGLQGPPGRDADAAQILELKAEIAALRAGLTAQPASPDAAAISVLVNSAVREAMAQIPIPKDGQDGASVSQADVTPLIVAEVEKAVAALPAPKDGAPGASVEVSAVQAMVEKAVAALPLPKDGQSLTPADVAPLIVSEVAKAVATIPPAKDGIGVVGALIDRGGHLMMTLSDGLVKDVGLVVGQDVNMADVTDLVTEELATWPRPKDGKDGADGLGFKDLDVVFDDKGRMSWRLMREDIVKTFPAYNHAPQGVWKAETPYKKADEVIWGGSGFAAIEDNRGVEPGKSNTPSSPWRMTVQRGRDGKQGPDGQKGLDGKHGQPGKDGTKTW